MRIADARLPLAVVAAVALLRVLFIPSAPLFGDEAFYAQITDELMQHPFDPIPHFLGYPSAYKAPAGFFAYAAVIAPLTALLPQLQVELAYRFAPAFYSILSVFVFYAIARELVREREAVFAAIVFGLANETLVWGNTFFLDSAFLFFQLAATYCYFRALTSRRWLLPAAAFSALSALTKTYVAFLIPVTAFGLAFYRDRQVLRDRAFLASLLSAPLALVAYGAYFSIAVPGGQFEIFSSYLYDGAARLSYGASLPGRLAANAADFFKALFPWGIISLLGAAALNMNKWQDKFAALWASVSSISLFVMLGYPWYYMPAVPPLALLASRPLSRLPWENKRLVAALCVAVFIVFSLTAFSRGVHSPDESALKEAGLDLRGEGRVLFLVDAGVPSTLFYQFHGMKNPGFDGVTQMVSNPVAPASYTAFRTLTEIVWGTHANNTLENATPAYVRGLIANASPDAVLLSARIYDVYSQDPLAGYPTSNNASGYYYVLKRAK